MTLTTIWSARKFDDGIYTLTSFMFAGSHTGQHHNPKSNWIYKTFFVWSTWVSLSPRNELKLFASSLAKLGRRLLLLEASIIRSLKRGCRPLDNSSESFKGCSKQFPVVLCSPSVFLTKRTLTGFTGSKFLRVKFLQTTRTPHVTIRAIVLLNNPRAVVRNERFDRPCGRHCPSASFCDVWCTVWGERTATWRG